MAERRPLLSLEEAKENTGEVRGRVERGRK